jgi:hypothetical protein
MVYLSLVRQGKTHEIKKQMRKIYSYLFVFAIIAIVVSACNSTQKTKKSKQPKAEIATPAQPPQTETALDPKIQNILNAVYANELKFNTFYAKIKTKATIDGRTQSFSTQMRWQKNQKIWLSMTIIGIEGARVLMNKDSIKIIDRLNNRNMLKPISYIQQQAYIELTYNDIEKILLAQPVFINTEKLELVENATENILKSNDSRFATVITLDKQNRIKNIFITDKLKKQTLNSDYSNFILLNGKYFPATRYINIASGSGKFNMEMEFNDIDLAKELSFPFEPNPKYKNE